MLLTRFYPLSLLKQLPVTNILQSNALLILYYVFTLQSCDRAVGGGLFDQRAGTTPHYCTDGLHLLLIDVDIRLCLAQQKNYKNYNCEGYITCDYKCTCIRRDLHRVSIADGPKGLLV